MYVIEVLDCFMEVITIMMILCVSHLSVRGQKQHAANIPAARRAGLIPHTFDMNLYWYELMKCYYVNGYPCKIDPMAFRGDVTCLTKDEVCDGIQQCPKGDDEMGQCGPMVQFCMSDQLRCANGKCARPCDGIAECPYGMDELSCNRCDKDELMCSDMKCAKICNGKRECTDGQDERGCLPECKRGEMICPKTGKCAQVCDDNAECNGKEDESSCGSNKPVKCDLNDLSKCIIASCVKNDCFGEDVYFGLADLAVCIADISADEFQFINGGGELGVIRGCDSKEQLATCMCGGGNQDCVSNRINWFFTECDF